MRKTLLLIVMLVSSVLTAEDKALTTRVDAYIAPFLAGNNFSGCILIARNWEPEVNKCYGLANQEVRVVNVPETRFHIASISKPFTAAAILLLQERGQFSMESPLQRFSPAPPNGKKITRRHLLTHTPGIQKINVFRKKKKF